MDIQRHVRTQRSYYQNVHKLQEKVWPLNALKFLVVANIYSGP